ncbi:hypothetical protein HYQ46_008150 [Verticillium longisporum]|nr:hypothetical protein HYQ46_008150 [Verticillium longisporum]
MRPCSTLLPWVPVEMAPAMDCSLMLPRLGMARPCFCKCAHNEYSLMPLCITTTPVSSLTERTLLKLSRFTSQLEVQVMLEGEWPHPVRTMRRRHVRARSITFSTSSRDSGWMYSSGRDEKVLAQVEWM